jgi:hypothetical protein
MANIAPTCSARVPSFPWVSTLLRNPLRAQGVEIPEPRRSPSAISSGSTLPLPAISKIPFRGQGEGIGRSYARLIKFTQKNAFGWALRSSLREQVAEIPEVLRLQGARTEGSITCQPLKNRDQIRLFVLKIIKLKNGHFTLEKSLY